jgi:hypothetical protein
MFVCWSGLGRVQGTKNETLTPSFLHYEEHGKDTKSVDRPIVHVPSDTLYSFVYDGSPDRGRGHLTVSCTTQVRIEAGDKTSFFVIFISGINYTPDMRSFETVPTQLPSLLPLMCTYYYYYHHHHAPFIEGCQAHSVENSRNTPIPYIKKSLSSKEKAHTLARGKPSRAS